MILWRKDVVLPDTESAALFKPLFEDCVAKHGVAPGQLTLHADRGPSMEEFFELCLDMSLSLSVALSIMRSVKQAC